MLIIQNISSSTRYRGINLHTIHSTKACSSHLLSVFHNSSVSVIYCNIVRKRQASGIIKAAVTLVDR
jgi:hypothetical protein